MADPGLPGSAPKLCWPGTPREAGPVIPSAPVLTGGVPSGYGVLSAPELVIGGSELWSGGAGGRMMLLLPPIGLAACALPAERSKAAAAAKIGNADFIGVTLCRKTVAQPRICASESVLGCGAWPLGRSGQVKRKAREVPRAFQASARHWAVSLHCWCRLRSSQCRCSRRCLCCLHYSCSVY